MHCKSALTSSLLINKVDLSEHSSNCQGMCSNDFKDFVEPFRFLKMSAHI